MLTAAPHSRHVFTHTYHDNFSERVLHGATHRIHRVPYTQIRSSTFTHLPDCRMIQRQRMSFATIRRECSACDAPRSGCGVARKLKRLIGDVGVCKSLSFAQRLCAKLLSRATPGDIRVPLHALDESGNLFSPFLELKRSLMSRLDYFFFTKA